MSNSQTPLAYIKAYIPPTLTTGKDWMITFYAFDPSMGKLRRKRLRVPAQIKGAVKKRQYARDVMEQLTLQLRQGWNPWVKFNSTEAYATWQDACDAYRAMMAKMLADTIIRQNTWDGYTSMLKVFNEWNAQQAHPVFYAYQFDQKVVSRFVDWLWLDKGLSSRTRDNYVGWLRTFGNWLVSHQYLEVNPAISLQLVGARGRKGKNRTVISPEGMARLKDWCMENNRHFLLACYIIYYCFIRPNEMTYIQLKHISVKRGTIFIPDYSSKNRKDGTVTLPDHVLKLMLDLEIFRYPDDFYLFSDKMMPGRERRDGKQFTDFWSYHIRKALGFPIEWKFYSLKDTGITDLIKDHADLLSVRNQARHHSLLMTDIYTPHDIEEANEVIRHRKADF